MKHYKEEAIQLIEMGKSPSLVAAKVILMNTDRLPDDLVAEVGKLLSPKELKKAARLRNPKQRRVYLAERGILRKLAGEVLKVAPATLQVGERQYGKPFLVGYEKALPMNISNSGSLVAIAFDFEKREVGVDLEKIDRTLDYGELAEAYFSPKERQNTKSHRDFYRWWTMKESLLKATGVGLVDDLPTIDLSAKQNRVKVTDERLLPFKNQSFTLFTFENEDVVMTLTVTGTHMPEASNSADKPTVSHVFLV